MSDPADQFKINLNQNLWATAVALAGLGLAEYHNLQILLWVSLVLAVWAVGCNLFSFTAYTYHYCKKKMKDARAFDKGTAESGKSS